MKKGCVPVLRFPEFRDGESWDEKTLGDITFKTDKKNKEGKNYPIYSINNKIGFVPQTEQFEGVDSNKRGYDTTLYKVIEKNTFAYNPARINVGSIGFSGGLNNIIISSLYVCFKTTKNVDDKFLLHFFETSAFSNSVNNNVEGGIRSYLFYENFSRINSALPKKEEQQKIADCLTSIDALITAQTQKLEALKAHKKGLMQQLFPLEGETVPKLRFPEFQDAAEWEQSRLGDIATIKSGATPLRSNLEFFEGGNIPWVKTTDLNNSFIYKTEECITTKAIAKINPVDSVLVAMYGGFNQIGRTGYLKVAAATNQAISVLNTDKKKVLPIYLHIWLNAKVEDWKRVASSSRKDPNITGSDVAGFPIIYPEITEQQKIADCVSSLDNLIAAQTQKLESLKTHKKGLMQQLFPAVDEVNG